jgi:hypothetical protein
VIAKPERVVFFLACRACVQRSVCSPGRRLQVNITDATVLEEKVFDVARADVERQIANFRV